MSIEEFKIIVSASEYEEGLYRGSIRSKEKSIVEIATKYGGGGHMKAAGLSTDMSLELIKQTLIAEVEKQLK